MRALCGRKSIRPATLRVRNGFSAIKPMWSADANHDIPLGMVVTTASRNDSPFLPSPLAKLASGHSWFSLPAGAVVIGGRSLSVTNPAAFLRQRPYPQPIIPPPARIRAFPPETPPCARKFSQNPPPYPLDSRNIRPLPSNTDAATRPANRGTALPQPPSATTPKTRTRAPSPQRTKHCPLPSNTDAATRPANRGTALPQPPSATTPKTRTRAPSHRRTPATAHPPDPIRSSLSASRHHRGKPFGLTKRAPGTRSNPCRNPIFSWSCFVAVCIFRPV